MADLPSGVGAGWRPEIAGWVAGLDGLGFCEVIAESVVPAGPPRGVADLRERGIPVIPHGVRLSLGGTEPLDAARVTHLAACASALDAPLVSEHVAFVRAGGLDAGHLLPLPRTREALDVLAANVARAQAELDVPLALEPIAALLDWPEDEFDEPGFLTALLDRTGALLLLDVANVYANALNRGQDARAILDRMPLDRVAYVHIAGGSTRHDSGTSQPALYHDTHTDAVPAAVLDLLAHVVEQMPAPPPVMLERDGGYPPAAELTAELEAIARCRHPGGRPSPTSRESSPDARESPCETRESAREHPRVGISTPASRHVSTHESTADHPRFGLREHVPGEVGVSAVPDLAARQAALVAALVAGGPDPAGVDPVRLDATRRALLRKRAGEAARHWPVLAASLGRRWGPAFAAKHAGHPSGGGLRDGWDVARALRRELTPDAERELAEREALLRYDGRTGPVARPLGRLRLLALRSRS